MAKPTDKAPEIDSLLGKLFGDRRGAIEDDICVACGEPATEFEDELSAKEYTISGLCQACQNETFKEPEEDSSDWPIPGDSEWDDDIPF